MRRAVQRAEFACRVVWKNERKTGERSQHGERRARSLDLKSLFVMADTAHEQAEADDAIAHNHNGGENSVARQSCLFGRGGDHDRDNQCRLDDSYGQGENKGAEWFPTRCATTSA